MKKTYMKPRTIAFNVTIQSLILASQGGVANGDSVGKSYDPNAVTYSRRGSFWEDEEE